MDPTRFDRLARLVGAPSSRRAALRLLAAGLLGPAALARDPRPAAAAICPERVPRPGYTPTANGCGPDGWDWVVPDNWRKADFTRACKGHDVCYGTCNSKRAKCDDAFVDGMLAACRRAYRGDSKRERRLRGDCNQRAYEYYTAVSDHGQEAYEDAQAEACLCCNQDGRGPKCGNTCCATGETCVDGQCKAACTEGRVPCGDICCPAPVSGQPYVCCNAEHGKCGWAGRGPWTACGDHCCEREHVCRNDRCDFEPT